MPLQGATGYYKGIAGVLAKTNTGCRARLWRWMPKKNSSVGSLSVLIKIEGGGGMS
jgi:hypothetical protein